MMLATFVLLSSVLVFNEDDSNFLSSGRYGMNVAGIRQYADTVLRGGVTHFFVCPNAMRSSVASKVYEPIWQAIGEPGVRADRRCFAAKELHDAGIDYVREFLSYARTKGVATGVSMRMNDVHFVTSSNFCGRSVFWRTHPELWRVPHTTHPWKWAEYAFDYAHREVRDYQLAYARELLGRYDADFFECDWLRFPDHLTPGRERELSGCLTSFMREIRRAADDAVRRLGHPVRVSVRVPSTVGNALAMGMDAVTWAREGLVDWVVPCCFFHTTDFAIPYGEWVARIGNSAVCVIPGADQNVACADGPSRRMTLEHYCGWADALYAQGAPGTYQFNFFELNPSKPAAQLVLREGLTPAFVRGRTRRYAVTYHEPAPDYASYGYQLPVALTQRRELSVIAGRPPERGSAEVWLGLATRDPAATNLAVSVNGTSAGRPAIDPDRSRYGGLVPCRQVLKFPFPVSALRAVTNIVSVGTLPAVSNLVVGCEIRIAPGD